MLQLHKRKLQVLCRFSSVESGRNQVMSLRERGASGMSKECSFCSGPVNEYDSGSYKEQTVWVHGKKKNGATLRNPTGRVAHESCIIKAKANQPPDQEELF